MSNGMEHTNVASALDRLDRTLRAFTRRVCLIAGWSLIVLSAVVTVNVLLRKLFNYSLQGVDEYGGYCLALCAAIGFSQAAFERGHIRIDVVTRLLPQRLRAVLDVVALAALNVTAWMIAIKSLGVFQASYEVGAMATSALRTQLSIPQGIWAAALLWFCFTLSLQLLRAVVCLAKRDWERIEREFGTPDVGEEVEQELEQARVRQQAKRIQPEGAVL